MYVLADRERLYRHPKTRKHVVGVKIQDSMGNAVWYDIGAYTSISDAYEAIERWRGVA